MAEEASKTQLARPAYWMSELPELAQLLMQIPWMPLAVADGAMVAWPLVRVTSLLSVGPVALLVRLKAGGRVMLPLVMFVAFVVSVLQLAALSLKSTQAGCALVKAPLALIIVAKLWLAKGPLPAKAPRFPAPLLVCRLPLDPARVKPPPPVLQAAPWSTMLPEASNLAQSPLVRVPLVVPTVVVLPLRVPLVKPPVPLLNRGVLAAPVVAAA